ncbi:FAR1-related sequence 1 [Rhynchospora pubera]|uniref:Protein FAR1-RELATED SEQUENCE n=1 Tax=Rhynchospora pubera TaxID=906938 RepID=A0AAV8G6H0_9POAL|nr:FAR1-related sequence 1 [Rhynchospora pubera]
MADPEVLPLPGPDSDTNPDESVAMVEDDEGDKDEDEDLDLKPKIGMYFETEDDAYEFYKKYAEGIGFVVRKSHKSRNTRLAVTKRWFVCHRQGFKQERSETKNPRAPGSRTGCGACLCIKIIPCGAFRVTEFVEEHNHPLADQPAVKMVLGPRAPPPLYDPKDGPALDMRFETEDDAYAFYNKYAEHVGFSVRKSYKKKHKGLLVSRIFVCSREGFAEKDKHRDPEDTPRRAGPTPSRTGCQACLIIKVQPPSKTFKVSKFVSEHNHPLEDPESVHKLRSHKLKSKMLELELPERRKRMHGMLAGDAGAALEYLQNLQVENPSLFYAVGCNDEGKAINFFWADAKSCLDYMYFNDVVLYDTTYSLNTYSRPFGLFIGVDNFRQPMIFGAALMYDDSPEGIKWLFQAFNDAMHGKQPGSVLTDVGQKYADAVAAVWPGSMHHATVWHVYHSAKKSLKQLVDNAKASFMHSFAPVMFENEDEPGFLLSWDKLVEKYNLGDNEWMNELYRTKDSWALPYWKHVFTADIITTLRKENIMSQLRKELNEQEDLLQLLKRYDLMLEEYRAAKLPVDTEAPLPIPTLRILKQVGNLYTTAAFKMFQTEFEDYMNSLAYPHAAAGMVSEYKVTIDEKPGEHTVRYDSLDGSVTCTCKRFESTGIQCAHVLKVLDLKNIKELPEQYIIRRWIKDARSGHFTTDLDSSLRASTAEARYKDLCRIASMIAARAARADEAMGFIESQSNALMKHLDHIFQTSGFSEMGNHAALPAPGPSSSAQPHNIVRGPQGNPLLRAANGILGV